MIQGLLIQLLFGFVGDFFTEGTTCELTQSLRKKDVQEHITCVSSPFYFCRIILFNTYHLVIVRAIKTYFSPLPIVVLDFPFLFS